MNEKVQKYNSEFEAANKAYVENYKSYFPNGNRTDVARKLKNNFPELNAPIEDQEMEKIEKEFETRTNTIRKF